MMLRESVEVTIHQSEQHVFFCTAALGEVQLAFPNPNYLSGIVQDLILKPCLDWSSEDLEVAVPYLHEGFLFCKSSALMPSLSPPHL